LAKFKKELKDSQAEEQAGFCRDASVADNHVVLQTVNGAQLNALAPS
jgi:hypothetical protein